MNVKQQNLLIFAIATIVCVFCYWPSLDGGWLIDDYIGVSGNELVTDSGGQYKIWFSFEDTDYWPLTRSIHRIQYQLFGDSPTAFRIVSLLLHIFVSWLVFVFCQRCKVPWPAIPAILFLLHPVNVSSAAWVSEQKNLLMTMFAMLAAIRYHSYLTNRNVRDYRIAIFYFTLALASKTACVFLPFVILFAEYLNSGKSEWRAMIIRSSPFFLLSLVMGLLTMYAQARVIVDAPGIEWLDRVGLAGWCEWFYIYKAAIPLDLMWFYPDILEAINVWKAVFMLPSLLIGGVAYVLFKADKTKLFFFLFFTFTILLFPILGIFKTAFQSHGFIADWYLYPALPVACIGMWLLLVKIIRNAVKPVKTVSAVIIAIYISFLSFATHERAGVFHDATALWTDNLNRYPDAWFALRSLGTEWANKFHIATGKVKRFRSIYKENEDLSMQERIMYSRTIDELIQTSNEAFRLAIYYYDAANVILPQAETYTAKGKVYGLATGISKIEGNKEDHMNAAKESYLAAMALMPDSVSSAYSNLIALLYKHGKREEIVELATTIQASKRNATASIGIADQFINGKEYDLAAIFLRMPLSHEKYRAMATQTVRKLYLKSGNDPKFKQLLDDARM